MEILNSFFNHLPFDLPAANILISAADILIVYYVIYRILLLIKGTRALQMLVGLALVIAAFFASKYFGLITINWIMENFLSNLILVIIVLFQNDIRRALTRVGRKPFLGKLNTREEISFFEEIIRASVGLSQKKVGGLIVIEKDADLTDYTEDATVIDAKVSSEIITSILMTSSPIHDGAIIIQQGRISSAGCFLPLTANPRVTKSLGTRHRAAIGLSEETDAVIIVISEETGKVSLVTEGKITRDLDSNTLRKVLQSKFLKKIS